MKLKLDANGNAVLQDGKPVYVHDDGKEVAFDAPATVATISRLNGEAKAHRERAEAAEGKLKGFEGIEDPAAALKALATIKNFDDKKLVDAGEVEKVKAEVAKVYEGKLSESNAALDKLQAQFHGELVGGSFARSKYASEKLAIPADLVQSHFGSRFKVEDGRVVAFDAHGNKIFSRAKPGELADFDEALETIIENYPNKAHILKGSGASGSGAQGSGASSGAKVMTRQAFDALDPAGRSQRMRDGFTVAD